MPKYFIHIPMKMNLKLQSSKYIILKIVVHLLLLYKERFFFFMSYQRMAETMFLILGCGKPIIFSRLDSQGVSLSTIGFNCA